MPRPFALRAHQLDGKRFEAGQSFYFDVILYEQPGNLLPYFVLAFRELARTGFGPAKGTADLATVEDLAYGSAVYRNRIFQKQELPGMFFDLTAQAPMAEQIFRIEFVTPTELKAGGNIVTCPDFPVFFSRLRDRIANLCACYQGGPLAIDFQALGTAAKRVALRASSIRHVDIERQSSRTGQRHSIGGFVGSVEYEGNVGMFLPFLKAGEWSSVGRQTVWGKGLFTVTL